MSTISTASLTSTSFSFPLVGDLYPLKKITFLFDLSHLKNEGLFFKSLRSNKKVIFFKGYRSPTSGKEKEVDVKLAVDIVDMTYRNMFDELFLLSGDADFMHALNIARNHNKPITVLALHNRIPFRFVHHFNTIIFGKEKNIKKHSLLKKSTRIKCVDLHYNFLLGKC